MLEVVHGDASDTVKEKLFCDVGLRYRRPTEANTVRDAFAYGSEHSGKCAKTASHVDDRSSDVRTDLNNEYLRRDK